MALTAYCLVSFEHEKESGVLLPGFHMAGISRRKWRSMKNPTHLKCEVAHIRVASGPNLFSFTSKPVGRNPKVSHVIYSPDRCRCNIINVPYLAYGVRKSQP